jgi:hypothetical protein
VARAARPRNPKEVMAGSDDAQPRGLRKFLSDISSFDIPRAQTDSFDFDLI